MDILDQILAADMAKQYSDSKGGYTKPGKVYTYDGGEDGEFVDFYGLKYVLLSKDVPDLHSIVKATSITGTTQQVEFAKGDFTFKENYGAEGINAVLVTVSGVTAPVVLAVEGIGFYGFATPGVDYLSYVEFAETIVPIDPKFLPGPVVLDLTKYDANGQSLNYLVLSLFTGGGGKTSVDNTDGTQAFWKDVNTDGRIQLMIDATSVKIVSDVKSTTLEPDGKTLVAIETSFLIQSAGQTARVTVMFGALSHTTEITLVVEFLTIPG